MKQIYYTVYKITNLLNNRVYVGAHKTDNLNDDYMGSGKLIVCAIKKYGIENFRKDYLSIFDSADEMWKMETQIVTLDFLKRDDVYNLHEGGRGGWEIENANSADQRRKCLAGNARQKILKEIDPEWFARKSDIMSKALKESYVTGQRISTLPNWSGRKHTEESREKMRNSAKGKHVGESNGMKHFVWIHNLLEKTCKCVPKVDLEEWLLNGWCRGRKFKFV